MLIYVFQTYCHAITHHQIVNGFFFRLQQKAFGGCDPLAKDGHPSTAHGPTSKFVVALV